ncbi:hypothetical protein IID24_00315 [Patescibacteria group bacterium]|nr:hypothetical protein [Patescibacteria group bacterium]
MRELAVLFILPLFNLLYLLLILFLQEVERKRGTIPERHEEIPETGKPFLYFQDFAAFRFGDPSLSAIHLGVGAVLVSENLDLFDLSIVLLVGIVAGIAAARWFDREVKKDERQDALDAGYVKKDGRKTATLPGQAHLGYWVFQVTVVVVALYFLVLLVLGYISTMWILVGLISLVVYPIANRADNKAGRGY